jgi:hypothetical protein
MKLIDLNPKWFGAGGEGITSADGSPAPERHGVGIMFDCPCGCDVRAFVPFSNPVDGSKPCRTDPHQWLRDGDTFESLTLSPSIHRVGGCGWHGFVRDGKVIKA